MAKTDIELDVANEFLLRILMAADVILINTSISGDDYRAPAVLRGVANIGEAAGNLKSSLANIRANYDKQERDRKEKEEEN